MITNTIKQLVISGLEVLNITSTDIQLEHPAELSHGDYATNVAMRYAKELDMNPRALAETLVADISQGLPNTITSIEVAGPGFINFRLSDSFFQNIRSSIDEKFGRIDILENTKVLVEHSSPNLFKAFHIGHVMNNTIGESVYRLMTMTHAQVIPISYPSDVSLGIGKAVWAFLQKGIPSFISLSTTLEKLNFLGDCYVEGTKAYEENETTQKEIRQITQDIYNETPGDAWDAYILGKEINLDYFVTITQRLGSHFDGFIFESEAGRRGIKTVRDNVGKVFQESDGAIIFDGESRGLHTRVFVNSEGNPTYESKDIGLIELKFEKYHPDISVIVTDHEQSEYFKVMLTSAGEIHQEWKDKTVHLTHGRMQFKGEKMSSRLGNVPLAIDMLNTVREEVIERLTDEQKKNETLIDQIAIGALKFAIIRVQAGKNINFDPETSLSFEGDSGPYLQYTHARCRSIVTKAGDLLVVEPSSYEINDVDRLLYRFPEVVEQAVTEYAPHHVANYLLELARAFNSWYGNNQIIVNGDLEGTTARVLLVEAVATVIKNGLWILGIDAPDKM